MNKEMIRISEIFGPTIQGEGSLIGQPTVFVRTGGCDYRCSWCDTLFAVDSEYRDQWQPMSATEIFAEIQKLTNHKPILITVSGGNPAIQPLQPLIRLAQDEGYSIALETQGSIRQPWFRELDHLILSPKPPSSDMDTDMTMLKQCIADANNHPHITLKIVVFDKNDFNYARQIHKHLPELPMVLQTGNLQTNNLVEIDTLITSTKQLIDMTIEHQWYDVKILPQLHTLLWGNERGR